ncbi:MAG TPA: hypothetical protein VM582_09480 [Candidatus Thermoplasmatota archaeon]|nr:hypothetical protein [Candidatus Thermoplasmatota archaeon]
MLIAVMMLAVATVPTAVADECVEVRTSTFADGLRLVANAARSIAIGVYSGAPGEGVGMVVVISPVLCGGVGVGGSNATVDPVALLQQLPPLIPLP